MTEFEFNCMTEANHRHWQSVEAARKGPGIRRRKKAFRRRVALVALDAALLGATTVALIVMVVCTVMGG